MPIGTIFGFLLGTLICGALIVVTNNKYKPELPEWANMVCNLVWLFGIIMFVTSFLAILGTCIELWVR